MTSAEGDKRPTSLDIGGRPWTVEWLDLDTFKRQPGIGEDDGVCGATYPQDLRIVIGTWQSPYLQKENLLHEVMHACFAGGTFVGDLSAETDFEEWAISGIDSPLLATLRCNMALTLFLLES